jgi:hypothetical protein
VNEQTTGKDRHEEADPDGRLLRLGGTASRGAYFCAKGVEVFTVGCALKSMAKHAVVDAIESPPVMAEPDS